jgi:RimJ/RimL family protein N-acetyltransferase
LIESDRLPTLDASRVRLRPVGPRDAPDLLTIFGDAEVMRYWSHLPIQTLAEASAIVSEIESGFAKKTLFQWGIALSADDRLIGTCTLFSIDPKNRRAELGYTLAREHWGRGLAREALVRLVDFAFGELRLRRLEADVDPRNHRSVKLLERLGFVHEGRLRERWNVGDELQDADFYGLLARDWACRLAPA